MSITIPSTVLKVPALASDAELLATVNLWLEALASEDYEHAYNMTAHDNRYAWTPSKIRLNIEGYGSVQKHSSGPFKITPIDSAKGGPDPRHDVHRLTDVKDGSPLADIWFDLPLNGKWSDLTATFAVYPLEGQIILCLEQIHVF
jgi:hypothetical protein